MGDTHDDRPPRSCSYEIRIRGRVTESFRTAFDELVVTVNPAETVVHAENLDQAALYAVLERIHALGLQLIEVRRLPSPPRTGS